MSVVQQEAAVTMVRYETDEKVGIITLDRAGKLNATNSVVKDHIIAAFARADKAPSTSVILRRARTPRRSPPASISAPRPIAARTQAPPIPTPGTPCCIAASTSASRHG